MNNPELSIIMPCLNEAETLERCILCARNFLETNSVNGEIIVGDSGSTDGSLEIAERLGVKIIHAKIPGYGAALLAAIRGSSGNYLIMADSDASYDFENLKPMLTKLREGNDLVMGNRFKGRIHENAMPWKNRYIGNPVLSTIGKILFRTPIGDFHCGIRGFSSSGFKAMRLKSTGMEFASEMVIKSSLFKLKIAEVPVELRKDGRSRPPHLKPWRDGWRHLRLMFLFSPRWLFLYPGILMMITGLFFGLRILSGTFVIGSLHLDLNTLIYAGSLFLIGFQCVWFAAFTKIFAIQEGLLPQDERLNKAFRFFNLETGLLAGISLILIGIGSLLHGVGLWKETGFTELDPNHLIRITYPSALALILGCQIIFSSFFLSVLGLRIEKESA